MALKWFEISLYVAMDVNFCGRYYAGNKIPCLVLNALDDFLCLKENIRTDLKDQIWNYVLYVTQYGGHVGKKSRNAISRAESHANGFERVSLFYISPSRL